MKKSILRKLIREEIQRLNEFVDEKKANFGVFTYMRDDDEIVDMEYYLKQKEAVKRGKDLAKNIGSKMYIEV